ncbi:hypothetical protein MRX96_054924 [Rhipicephalus microplus]
MGDNLHVPSGHRRIWSKGDWVEGMRRAVESRDAARIFGNLPRHGTPQISRHRGAGPRALHRSASVPIPLGGTVRRDFGFGYNAHPPRDAFGSVCSNGIRLCMKP